MKHNSPFRTAGTALAFLILFSSAIGRAGGGSIAGNGGSSVVCFSIPLAQAMQQGLITRAGSQNIESAWTLEYYLASLVVRPSAPFFAFARAGDALHAIEYIETEIASIRGFDKDVQKAAWALGKIENGVGSAEALQRIDDVYLPVELPSNCALVQTVIRMSGFFYYDTVVWAALGRQDTLQQKLMQFHEEIYDLSVRSSGDTTSAHAQQLIVSILTRAMDDSKLQAELIENGFPDYLSKESLRSVEFFRYFNLVTNSFFYSSDEADISSLFLKESGWTSQDVEGEVFERLSGKPRLVPLYQLHHPERGYFYTINIEEKDTRIASDGYAYDGVAAYVHPDPGLNERPINHAYNPNTSRDFYTANKALFEKTLQTGGWVNEGVAFYVEGDYSCFLEMTPSDGFVISGASFSFELDFGSPSLPAGASVVWNGTKNGEIDATNQPHGQSDLEQWNGINAPDGSMAGTYTRSFSLLDGDRNVVCQSNPVTFMLASPAPPTAMLMANGSTDITLIPGQRITYVWLADSAVASTASISVDGGAASPWASANHSLSGAETDTINASQVGHIYVITYRVANAQGQYSSASVTVRVIH